MHSVPLEFGSPYQNYYPKLTAVLCWALHKYTVVGHKSGHFFGVFLSLKILKGRKIDFVSANKG